MIDKELYFKCLVIIVFILILFNYSKLPYTFILLLIFAIAVSYFYYIYSKKVYTNTNENIMKKLIKLESICGKLDNLYIDSDLIEFFYSISFFSKYNHQEFNLLLKGANNILKIRKQIEDSSPSSNINSLFEQSVLLKTNTMNNLHRFIYNIPKTNSMYNFLDNALNTYNILITRSIDILYNYTTIKPININKKFYDYDHAKPNDPSNTFDWYI